MKQEFRKEKDRHCLEVKFLNESETILKKVHLSSKNHPKYSQHLSHLPSASLLSLFSN